jgi:peptidoglycan/xylan/chitin deacetylase (PgdA/CDA1 family)
MIIKKITAFVLSFLMAVSLFAMPAQVFANIDYGHVRGRTYINGADVTLLRRYVATAVSQRQTFANTHGVNRANADVNGDGTTDFADIQLLRHYLAGGNVTLGPTGGRRYPRASDFPAGTRFIAFTFDDGPNSRYTVQILDILAQHDARATFYVNPFKFNNPSMWHPSGAGLHANTIPVVQRMIAEGHDVCNHTQNHSSMGGSQNYNPLSPPTTTQVAARANLREASQNIFNATGYWPWSFRAPFFEWGGGANMLHGLDRELNLVFVDSALDPSDYANQGTGGRNTISNWVLSRTDSNLDGGIVLLHDCGGARPETVGAVAIMVPALKARGFEIVTVRELFMIKESMPEGFLGTNMWPRVNQWVPSRRGQWDPFEPMWPNTQNWYEQIATSDWYTNPIPPWDRPTSQLPR